jgi:hypothetical protein
MAAAVSSPRLPASRLAGSSTTRSDEEVSRHRCTTLPSTRVESASGTAPKRVRTASLCPPLRGAGPTHPQRRANRRGRPRGGPVSSEDFAMGNAQARPWVQFVPPHWRSRTCETGRREITARASRPTFCAAINPTRRAAHDRGPGSRRTRAVARASSAAERSGSAPARTRAPPDARL